MQITVDDVIQINYDILNKSIIQLKQQASNLSHARSAMHARAQTHTHTDRNANITNSFESLANIINCPNNLSLGELRTNGRGATIIISDDQFTINLSRLSTNQSDSLVLIRESKGWK